MQADKDYYKILQVDIFATEDEIRKSYRVLVRKYHPDVNNSPDAPTLFQNVQEAYELLGNPDQRRAYDRLRESEGYDKSSAISLRTIISHKALLTNVVEQAFYILLDIAPSLDLPVSRLPLNLCLVLDRSTSMQGMRLQQVKEGTRQIIDCLKDEDTLSLVVFSDRSEVIFPSQKNIDKAMAKSITSTIQPSGGTEMLKGLVTGLQELEKCRSKTSVNHLILLTDGQTYGDNDDCLKKAEWASHNHISITTMGIGSDWNETLLDKMASVSGGTSFYIDSPRKVVDIFKTVISSLSTVVARELSMTINPSQSVTIKDVFQVTPYINRLDVHNGKIVLGPLGTDNGKALIMEFRVSQEVETGKKRLARLTVDGDVPGQSERRNWEWAEVFSEFVTEFKESIKIPPMVVTALGKLAIYKMQEKAMVDLSEGRVTVATQRLETMATRLLNLGETELARAALLEAGRLARTGSLSDEGRKKIRYGTRSLSVLPKEIQHD